MSGTARPELECGELPVYATSAPVSPSRSVRASGAQPFKSAKSMGGSVRFLDPAPYDMKDLRRSTMLARSIREVDRIVKESTTSMSYVDVGDHEDEEMAPAFKMLNWLEELSTDMSASEQLSPEQRATALGYVAQIKRLLESGGNAGHAPSVKSIDAKPPPPTPKPRPASSTQHFTPLNERDGGYFYYHVNFGITIGVHIFLILGVAAEFLFAPDVEELARLLDLTGGEAEEVDNIRELQVAEQTAKISTVATILLATLLQCTYVRSEMLFVQPLYFAVTRIPLWVPLYVRKRLARWVYSLGGFHSGSGVSLLLWLILLLVLQVMKYKTMGTLGSDFYGDLTGETSISFNGSLVATLALVICTASWHRGLHHNLFEFIHRWVGWFGLGLTWGLYLALKGERGLRADNINLWLLITTTFLTYLPWLMVRRLEVSCYKPSGHALVITYNDAAPACGTFGRISHSVLGEYHTFALITPDPKTRSHKMIVAAAGDWTKALIASPPRSLWVRTIRPPGFMATVRMFKSTILVHTGAGIAPGLPYIFQKDLWPNVKHVVWTTRSPKETFGEDLTNQILSMPSITVWDSTEKGRPDVVKLTLEAWHEHKTEVIHVVSNEPNTIKVVNACRKVGVPAFGAIWDS